MPSLCRIEEISNVQQLRANLSDDAGLKEMFKFSRRGGLTPSRGVAKNVEVHKLFLESERVSLQLLVSTVESRYNELLGI